MKPAESSKRRESWRFVTMLEVRGKFTLVFPFTLQPILDGERILFGLKKTAGLTLAAALEAGDIIESWRAGHEGKRSKRGNTDELAAVAPVKLELATPKKKCVLPPKRPPKKK